MTPNNFKHALRQRLQPGLWYSLCSPITTVIVAAGNFDDAVERMEVPAGILTTVEQDVLRYIEWGFSFVAVGSDLNLPVGPWTIARAASNRTQSEADGP